MKTLLVLAVLVLEAVEGSVKKPKNADVVHFNYWTSSTSSVELRKENGNNPMTPNKPTYLIIDGFLSTNMTPMLINIKNALFHHYVEAREVNVITTDWSEYSGALEPFPDNPDGLARQYEEVVSNVPLAENEVVEILEWIVKDGVVVSSDINIIGHSLGGQMAGGAGHKYAELGTGKIERLVGLDPAGYLYDYPLPKRRLQAADGNYVMVVHTDSRCNLEPVDPPPLGSCGYIDVGQGHTNIYINGGKRVQPAHPAAFVEPHVASHSYSYHIFAALIRGDITLKACSCSFVNGECRKTPRENPFECVTPQIVDFPLKSDLFGYQRALTSWIEPMYTPARHEVGFGRVPYVH